MNTEQLELRQLPLQYFHYRELAAHFLEHHNLNIDKDLEYYLGIYEGGVLVGGAGYSGKVIKCVAVDEKLRGIGLTNTLISHLIKRIYDQGYDNILLFTKPENQRLFEGTGFYPVESSVLSILMETNPNAFSTYLAGLQKIKHTGFSAAIVMNCNPFTLGHQYLVEYAASRCDTLHLFVVEEEKSAFPFAVRYKLVEAGTAHLKNVILHRGGDYIISSATFPAYFIRDEKEAIKTQTELDLRIFGRHIAPALGITLRFAGEEPLSQITQVYNQGMSEILPTFGVQTEIIKRLEISGKPISASRVRENIYTGNMERNKELLPETSFDFLVSAEAEPIIRAIRLNQ
jgi:[citrate (pro-3S)-lyase] ligase